MKQMKKLGVLAFAFLLCGVNVMAKGKSPVSVTSGSLDFIKKGGTAAVVFDYSGLQVNGLPLDDFLASQDEKFNNDWESVIVPDVELLFRNMCSMFLNRGSFIVSPGDVVSTDDYKIVLRLTSLDLGSASGVYNPFAVSMKAGGAVISGSLEGIDNRSGETLCVVDFDKLQGAKGVSDKDRWSSAYRYLINLLNVNLKK